MCSLRKHIWTLLLVAKQLLHDLHLPFYVLMLVISGRAAALWLCVITPHDWSVRVHLKGLHVLRLWIFFTLAIHARFSLLKKLARNCLAFSETKIFSIRFLNGFMLDASRARWCGWPHLPTPKCCVCQFGYMALQPELMTSNISPQRCFTGEKPAHVFVFLSLSTVSSHSLPHLHSSRGRGSGLEEQMFTSWSLWLPRYTVSHWVSLTSWVWLSRMCEGCSPLLMLVKPATLESHKCDGRADTEICFRGLKLSSGQYD